MFGNNSSDVILFSSQWIMAGSTCYQMVSLLGNCLLTWWCWHSKDLYIIKFHFSLCVQQVTGQATLWHCGVTSFHLMFSATIEKLDSCFHWLCKMICPTFLNSCLPSFLPYVYFYLSLSLFLHLWIDIHLYGECPLRHGNKLQSLCFPH